MFDENGFYHLTPKVKPTVQPAEHKKKKKSDKPFKKGGWKSRLYKLGKKWKTSPYCERFHFTKMKNLLVRSDKSGTSTLTEFDHKLKNKIIRKDSNAYTLINVYDGIYVRVPLKTYSKLCSIDKIIISVTLRGSYDTSEYYDITSDEFVINNINDLFRYIVQHRFEVEGILDVESMCCGFTTHEHEFKMLVLFTDGTHKTYMGDFNEFLKDYEIKPFI